MLDDTRVKILKAAEELFSDQGFANTSLRAITTLAGVNLAAVNYHFGSKEALIQEIFSRRLETLNRQRLDRLSVLQQTDTALTVEAILDAYLAPTLQTIDGKPDEARFMRLLGRTHMGASASLREFVHSLYAEVLDKFATALSKALPQIPHTELYWRLHFLTGTVAYSLASADTAELYTGCQLDDVGDNAVLLRRLIPFLAAGLRAPVTGNEQNNNEQNNNGQNNSANL